MENTNLRESLVFYLAFLVLIIIDTQLCNHGPDRKGYPLPGSENRGI